MDPGGMEMVEQGEPLLPATQAPPDLDDLSEVVVDQQAIVADAARETAPVPVADPTPLLLACKEGRAEEAKKMLETKNPALSKAAINMVDEEGQTALTHAINSKMSDVALALIAQGAKCDVVNNFEETALNLACSSGWWPEAGGQMLTEVIKELLKGTEKGGPGLSLDHINKKNVWGDTALINAIRSKKSDVVLHLMKRGAKCDVISNDRNTPLIWALQYGAEGWDEGYTEVVEELLKEREEGGPVLSLDHINTERAYGHCDTALTCAIRSKMSDVALRLIKRGANVTKNTPLRLACENGLTQVAKKLLKGREEGVPGLGLDHINTESDDGHTALTCAIVGKMSDVALKLMRRGESCHEERNVITNAGYTPLMLACMYGLPEVAEELLNTQNLGSGWPGLSLDHINLANDDGQTALILAIGSKMSDIAILLIKRGAKRDVITKCKYTPLILAFEMGLPEVAQELLKGEEEGLPGLSLDHINAVNDDGVTALTVAISEHMLEVMKRLLDLGAKSGPDSTPLCDACRFSFREGALELLAREEYNKDIHTPGRDGKMPLEWAVMKNLTDVSAELLRKGAHIQNNEKKVIDIELEGLRTHLDESVTLFKPEGKGKLKSEEKLVLNYSFLTREGKDQTPALNSLLNLSTEHRELVKHPVVKAFLIMKWNKMVFMWILWITLKLVFFVHLVFFAWSLKDSNAQGAIHNKTCKATTNPLKSDNENSILMIGQMFFTLLVAFFWFIEAVQMLTSIKAWSSEGKNWLQTAILGGSTYLCIAMFSGSGHCESKHVVATLLPMAYYEGLFEVGYHYKLAKYINVFNRVLMTFCRYFVVYVGMIICFAGGYSVMLPAPKDPANYPDTFWRLLPKVFVMVTGEEEFMNIPFTDHPAFRVWEVTYFLAFVMFTVIVLLNLLNGLAVADAREMLEASETDSLCSLLKTAAFWDKKFMYKSDEKNLEDEIMKEKTVISLKEEVGREKTEKGGKDEGQKDCNLNAKLKLPWTKLKNWWHEDEGKVLNLPIPHFIKNRMKWFYVLKSDSPNYFFSVYEGENKTYKAYTSTSRDAGFTIDQELKKMALQIIHTRNLAEQKQKEKEREKKEREQILEDLWKKLSEGSN